MNYEHKIFINEKKTNERTSSSRRKIYFKNKNIDSVWTFDGRIVAKTLPGKKWTITMQRSDFTDFEKLS